MASEVKYRITAEDNTRPGTTSAEHNFDGLGSAVTKLGNIFAGMIAAFSMKKIIDGVADCTKEFGQAQTGLLKLAGTIKNNPLLNGESAKGLINYSKEMQNLLGVTDDEILSQEAFLSASQRSEDQIKSIIMAAQDLASGSGGLVSVDTALRSLNSSFDGEIGRLGVVIPALKNLTTEQLKAGGAIELVKKQYGGLAQLAASGIEGQKKIFDRSIDELKESIGKAFAPVQGAILTALKPVIDSIATWFDENSGKIASFFINLPEIAGVAFDGVKQIIAKVFTGEGMSVIVTNMTNLLIAGFTTAVMIFGDLLVGVIKTIPALLNIMLTTLQASVLKPESYKTLLTPDQFKRMQKQGVDGLDKFTDSTAVSLRTGASATTTAYQKYLEEFNRQNNEITEKYKTSFDTITTNVLQTSGKIKETFDANIERMGGIVKDMSAPFAPIVKETGDKIAAIINNGVAKQTDVVNDAMNRLSPPIQATTAPTGTGGNSTGAPGISNETWGALTDSPLPGIMRQLSEMFGPFIGKIIDVVMALENVQAILDPLSVIVKGFADVIAGPVNKALQPLVNLLTWLGNTLGQIVLPVIDFFAKIILGVATFIATIFNGIADVINFLLGWMGVHISKIDTATLSSAPSSSTDQTDTGGTGSGTTQYTAAPVITMNINIYATAITAGDKIMTLEDLAKLLNEKLNSALELG